MTDRKTPIRWFATAFIILTLLVASCSAGGELSAVETKDAWAVTDSDLLGSGRLETGAYTGPGSYAVLEARMAYNSDLDATAVAAKVSVSGEGNLCLFWYIDGDDPGDGITLGDDLTRDITEWGWNVTQGSRLDDMVTALKDSPEGRAVLAASGC